MTSVFCVLCNILVFVQKFFFLCIPVSQEFLVVGCFPRSVFRSVAKFCSTWRIVSFRSHPLLVCILIAYPMLLYLTPVAPRYPSKLFAGTAIVFSEPDDIVSVSLNSGISRWAVLFPFVDCWFLVRARLVLANFLFC